MSERWIAHLYGLLCCMIYMIWAGVTKDAPAEYGWLAMAVLWGMKGVSDAVVEARRQKPDGEK